MPTEHTESHDCKRISDLIDHDDVRDVLGRFACEYKPSMSAKKFLSYFPFGLESHAFKGNAIGKSIGFGSKSSKVVYCGHGAVFSAMATVAAMLASGIEIEEVSQVTDNSARVLGNVPSSIWHFEGKIEASLTGENTQTSIEIVTVYPGQIMAWGAGARLIRRIEQRLEEAAVELAGCESLRCYR